MNIGVINTRSFKVDDGQGGKKEKSYLEMSIRPPFMNFCTFTISANKYKINENEPDYLINFSFNRKGESFPRVRASALWNKTSKDGSTNYIGGQIESPVFPGGKLYISIFEAKEKEGFPPPTHKHDVVWTPSKENTKTNDYYDVPTVYETVQTHQSMPEGSAPIDISDDEIPF